MRARIARKQLDVVKKKLENCPNVIASPAIREIGGQDTPIFLVVSGCPDWLCYEPGFSAEEVTIDGETRGFRHLAEDDIFLVKTPPGQY